MAISALAHGHFTLRLARAVEPDGVVYALDASQSTLDDLRRAADDRGITTLRPCWSAATGSRSRSRWTCCSSRPPTTICPDPPTYFAEARAYLRPGASVAILESRREGLLARWHGRHATSPRRVLREMTEAGYRLMATHDVVRGYWFGLFEALR